MKKYIVTLAGGIGNQMLQYALYCDLKNKGNNCILYLKPDKINDHHGFNINCLYLNIAIEKESKFFDALIQIDQFKNRFAVYSKKKYYLDLFSWVNNFLPYKIFNFPQWTGYHQIFKEDVPLNELSNFPAFTDKKNLEVAHHILNSNSVSIHIRRGDYVNNPKWRNVLGDICGLDYYKKAIKIIETTVKSPLFVIFSDDIQWTKSNLKIENAIYVDWNIGNESYRDIQLMSICSHNIIANSTFSLVGAYLNKNEGKIVIAPSKWRNYSKDVTGEKFIDPHWIVIDTNSPHCSIILEEMCALKCIKSILSQSFSDFELIIKNSIDWQLNDSRIKTQNNYIPKGKHLLTINSAELFSFKDRSHLRKILFQRYLELTV